MAAYGQLPPEVRKQIIEQRIARLEADHFAQTLERVLQEAGGDSPEVLARTDASIASLQRAITAANDFMTSRGEST